MRPAGSVVLGMKIGKWHGADRKASGAPGTSELKTSESGNRELVSTESRNRKLQLGSEEHRAQSWESGSMSGST